MPIIRQRKKDVKRQLRKILEWYENKRSMLQYTREQAIVETLDEFNDFYHWLQKDSKEKEKD